MKRLAFLLITLLVALAGCGGDDEGSGTTTSAAGSDAVRVGVVTDIGQLNDRGFNQLAYQGLKRAQRELGIKGSVYQSPASSDYIPNLTQAARKGADLVISVGFDQASAISKVARNFPDTNFAIID